MLLLRFASGAVGPCTACAWLLTTGCATSIKSNSPRTQNQLPSLYERVAAKLQQRPDLATLDQPPLELESVRWMIGHWDIETTVFATPSSPERVERGEGVVSSVMKGFWLQSADSYPHGTQDLGFLTYNRANRMWVSLGIDSAGNAVIFTASGWSNDRFVFNSPSAEVLGEKVVLRQTLQKIGNDEFLLLNEEQLPNGDWHSLDQYHYRRHSGAVNSSR